MMTEHVVQQKQTQKDKFRFQALTTTQRN